jgi:hypothetical protein
VLLLLSLFLHSLFSFREGRWEAGEAVRVTERTLSLLSKEPGLLENLEPGGKWRIWRGEELLAGGEKPGGRTVVLPAALRRGLSAELVEVEAWE